MLRVVLKLKLLGAWLCTVGYLGISTWAATDLALLQEDFPFQAACISAKFPAANVAMKGVAIRVGNGASVLFDTELLRMAAGWTGKFITTFGVAFDGHHGGHPSIEGDQKFGTKPVPGWINGSETFRDPRPEPFGALPEKRMRWDGIFLSGSNVVLAYTVHGTKIREYPASTLSASQAGFVRTFKISNLHAPLALLVCDVDAGTGQVRGDKATLTSADGKVTQVGVAGLGAAGKLEIVDNRVILRISAKDPVPIFKVVIWSGSQLDSVKFPALLGDTPQFIETTGSPARWSTGVVTRGILETSKTPDGAYVTDSLTPPTENPWKRRVRFGGIDFFKDGTRAALCTWDGDIWIVSGIDDKLEKLTWRRFASGMYETLGLKIVDDVIYTSGRDQMTRYHDADQNGEADHYENFNNHVASTEGFHEFVFDLQTDARGDFYFSKAGPVRAGGVGFERIGEHSGTLMKVSRDGAKLEVVATGFRGPNGISVGPNGAITTCDNEGTWVPACPIYWIKPGGFYGVEPLAHKKPVPAFDKPICWLSRNGWDNSSGGQTWVTSSQWGPFAGELLHTSYGQCALFLVMKQDLANQVQGGVVRIPLRFSSGIIRPKFNPRDGQLYVAGLQGWQTTATKITGLDRVRYTGKPVYSIRGLNVNRSGIHLNFTQPLDQKEACDIQNYAVQRWNYERGGQYGSPEFMVSNPKKRGREPAEVVAATLSADRKTVTLTINDFRPVMQSQIKFSLRATDGTAIEQTILHTIHEIPEK